MVRRRRAIRGADCYYLLHNHPSGDPTPSKADVIATHDFERLLRG